MKHALVYFASLFTLACLGHDFAFSESGIPGPKYDKILDLMVEWKKSAPQLIELIDYGKSVQGRTLRLAFLRKPGNFAKRSALFMSGATHGNEYLNLEDRLPAEILKLANGTGPVSRFIDQGGVYVFVPILNPDGYEANQRGNANGKDLNRDWTVKPISFEGFKEIETKLLASKLKELQETHNLKYQVTVDYHCCIGALLHPWSYPNAPNLESLDAERHKAVGELMQKNLKMDFGTTGEILGYFPVGTTKDYFFDQYKAAAFTYEGRYAEESKYLEQHLRWWEDMTALVSGTFDFPQLPISQRKKSLLFLAD